MRRILVFLLPALVALAACGAPLSPAIEVNSEEVSRSDLLEQTADLAEPLGLGDSTTVTNDFTREVILVRINEMLLNQVADDLGVEVTDEHFDQSVELIETNYVARYPDPETLASVVDLLRNGFAVQFALGETADVRQLLAEGYAEADIFVDPRFGTWDAETGQVLPPPGPTRG